MAVLTGTFAVFRNATVQHKISVFRRLVVDQPVQLGTVKAIAGNVVLTAVQSMEVVPPSAKSSSTQPVSMLNSQEIILLMAKTFI